jgi:hypothetical protein
MLHPNQGPQHLRPGRRASALTEKVLVWAAWHAESEEGDEQATRQARVSNHQHHAGLGLMMTTHPDTEDTSHTTARMQADADAPPPPGAARMLMQDARRRQHMRLLWSIYEGGFAEQLTMLDGTPPPRVRESDGSSL